MKNKINFWQKVIKYTGIAHRKICKKNQTFFFFKLNRKCSINYKLNSFDEQNLSPSKFS